MRNRYIDARNEMLVILWSAVVISAFLLALFMVSSSRGSHRGRYGSFSSGSGSFGGFGGGGFGGGGGGSFGGGGAGGSW